MTGPATWLHLGGNDTTPGTVERHGAFRSASSARSERALGARILSITSKIVAIGDG
jgi:hypothetical protein